MSRLTFIHVSAHAAHVSVYLRQLKSCVKDLVDGDFGVSPNMASTAVPRWPPYLFPATFPAPWKVSNVVILTKTK